MGFLLDLDGDFFKFFVTDDETLSHWHEDVQQRTNLLVTIGDSWTWGDSLGISDHSKKISDPNRVNLIYGKHLQRMLGNDYDWVNIAYPGTANQWIVDVALRFPAILKKCQYQKVLMSVGLTDITRDQHERGYHPDAKHSLLKSMEYWEKDYLRHLSTLNDHDIKLVVGRNFTNTFLSNIDIFHRHLPMRWIDITANNWQGSMDLPNCVGMKLPDNLSAQDKIWAESEGIPNSLKIIEFLDQCPLHYKKASKHPTEKAHEFWANYVYENLKIFYPDFHGSYSVKKVVDQ
jgi:hypothetical protein